MDSKHGEIRKLTTELMVLYGSGFEIFFIMCYDHRNSHYCQSMC